MYKVLCGNRDDDDDNCRSRRVMTTTTTTTAMTTMTTTTTVTTMTTLLATCKAPVGKYQSQEVICRVSGSLLGGHRMGIGDGDGGSGVGVVGGCSWLGRHWARQV